MAVNNRESTNLTRQAVVYFNNFLERKWREPGESLCVEEQEFGYRIKEAGNAVALLFNPIFRGFATLALGEDSASIIPSYKEVRHVSTICSTYADGKRELPRGDIQELSGICDSLVKCIEAIERTKK